MTVSVDLESIWGGLDSTYVCDGFVAGGKKNTYFHSKNSVILVRDRMTVLDSRLYQSRFFVSMTVTR